MTLSALPATKIEARRVLVACRVFGASGQPWLWRQVVGLERLDAQVLCWDRENSDVYPLNDIPVHTLSFPAAPYDDDGRWLHRIRNIGSRNFYAATGAERDALDQLLARVRPDVLLCQFGDIAMRLLPIAQKHGVPVVAHFHGTHEFFGNRWYRWSLDRCLRQFAAVVVINSLEARWMIEQGVQPEKVHVIPCGAPTDVFLPRPANRPGPIRFVAASRLVAQKGLDLTIAAFARVCGTLPDAQLHIFGDGPMRHELHAICDQQNLMDRVTFHGYVSTEQLAERLPEYDVLVQHSLASEGFGVSIAEAASCGLPVVATRLGGICDQVRDGVTGLLFAERDVDAMANAMLTLARDSGLRRRMGQAGRERTVAEFDTRKQIARLERVLLDRAADADREGASRGMEAL